MPLSFRLSYKKRPGVDPKKETRAVGPRVAAKVARLTKEFRPEKYPMRLVAGCGLAIGLCLFAVFSPATARLLWVVGAAPADDRGASTAAFETALAEQLGTLEVQRQTEARATQAPATVTPSPTETIPNTPTQMPVKEYADDEWVTAIPVARCIQHDIPQMGRVVEVVDGDTIRVLLDSDGRVYSVRYLGIDAPSLYGDSLGLGRAAVARNSEMVFQKQAVLVRDITDSDGNGTLLRYVLVEGVFLNHALVQDGLAQVVMTAPDTSCLDTLLTAEREAQAETRGLWSIGLTPTSMP